IALPPCKLVRAKGINDIPWNLRHGPIFRNLVFQMFASACDISEILGREWHIEDFLFRELAYHVLCIAAGGDHMTITDDDRIKQKSVYAFLYDNPCERNKNYRSLPEKNEIPRHFPQDSWSEFVSQLLSGSHLEVMTPGSSPSDTVYWFNGALVILTNQLTDPSDIQQGLHPIMQHHNKEQSKSLNAILISLTHTILVKIFPNNEIEHTETMALFRTDQNTFYTLTTFFDSIARSHMHPSKTHSSGRFPTEIYALIIAQVLDLPTRNACMQVTPLFRNHCLQNYFIADNAILTPSEACKNVIGPGITPAWFMMKDVATQAETRVAIVDHDHYQYNRIRNWSMEGQLRVLLGGEFNRRTVLPFQIMMKSLDENKREDEWQLKTRERGLGWELKWNIQKRMSNANNATSP
ncbi:MAG: hypothetical protein Q9169_005212, partial [Polycauliona sp. 2 TL-2023]